MDGEAAADAGKLVSVRSVGGMRRADGLIYCVWLNTREPDGGYGMQSGR